MRIMLARDVMTTEVITVHQEEKLKEVARILMDNKISGLPVVADAHHVVGIISEKDMVVTAGQLQIPFYITLFDGIIFLENPKKFQEKLKRFTASKVKEVMSTEVIFVEEDTPLDDVISILQKHKINRLPVLRNDKLVGIISRNDILKAMVQNNG